MLLSKTKIASTLYLKPKYKYKKTINKYGFAVVKNNNIHRNLHGMKRTIYDWSHREGSMRTSVFKSPIKTLKEKNLHPKLF